MIKQIYKKYLITERTNILINIFLLVYAFSLPFPFAKNIAAILFYLWMIEANFKNKLTNIFKIPSVSILLIFTFYILVSILWTETKTSEILSYMFEHKYILIAIIMATSLKKVHISKIIVLFLLGMFVSELISYSIFFQLIDMKYPSQIPFGIPSDPAPFFDHLDYSVFLAITALLLLYKIITIKTISLRVYSLLFFLSATSNLFLIGGRTGQIAFLFSIILLFFSTFKNRLKALVFSLLLIGTIFLIAYNSSNTFHKRVLTAKSDINKILLKENYNSSWGNRAACWILSSKMIMENPIIGIGFKDNIKELKSLSKNGKKKYQCIAWFPHFHSEYLEITTAIGFIGLFIFLYFFYEIFSIKYKNNEIKMIQLIFLSTFFIAFFADPFLEKRAVLMLFGMLYGVLLTEYKYEYLEDNK